MSRENGQCPVDHSASSSRQLGKCPVDHGTASEQCPVDHNSRTTWGLLGLGIQNGTSKSSPIASSSKSQAELSTEREVSSIPRTNGENWVYPSEAQFFAAMARKRHNPQEKDMGVIVPIHNAVNERAWAEVMKWENGQGGEHCGGIKLVSFKGRPQDLTPRARWRSLLGYQAPFDRHDWVVDRCGTRIRYVIDFYTGKSTGNNSNVSFYLDVRPALDNWEGVRMRTSRFCEQWTGASAPHSNTPSSSTSSNQSERRPA